MHRFFLDQSEEKRMYLFLNYETNIGKTIVFVPKLRNKRKKLNAFVLQLWNERKKTYIIVPEQWNNE